jgi:AAA domain/Domain of unknown function (DUF3854)
MISADQNGHVSEDHLQSLFASGLTRETIGAARIRSVSAEEARRILGQDCGPGILFPYQGTRRQDGREFERIKPDHPRVREDGKSAKYLSPTRKLNPDGNRLYVPATLSPTILADPSSRLIITEGEKKTLAAIQAGFSALGLAGVWAWRKRDDDDQSQPIDDLIRVQWRGRCVFIIFDSDAAVNKNVQAAERAFKHDLERRGARVYVVRLPEPTFEEAQIWGPKLGLDDLLLLRGRAGLTELIDETMKALPLGCRTLASLLAEKEKALEWLVEGVWPLGGCGFFAGEPKSQKSFLSNYLALAVATGTPFLGRAVLQGSVVIVDEENDRAVVKDRLCRTAAGLGLNPANHDIYIANPGIFRLDDEKAIEEMDQLLERVKPALVILDPLVRLHGGDENDTSAVSGLLGRLRKLKNKHGSGFLIVHHLRKKNETNTSLGQRMRGSSDLHGWLDAALYFENQPEKRVRVSFESRYAPAADPVILKLCDQPDGSLKWETLATLPPSEAKRPDEIIVAALSARPDGLDRDGLKTATGLSKPVIAEALPGLLQSGSVLAKRVPTGGKPREVFYPSPGPDLPFVSSPPLGGGTEGKKSADRHPAPSGNPS